MEGMQQTDKEKQKVREGNHDTNYQRVSRAFGLFQIRKNRYKCVYLMEPSCKLNAGLQSRFHDKHVEQKCNRSEQM